MSPADRFDWLVRYIKDDGCKVILYNKNILKQVDCVGTFDISRKKNPIICLAIKGHTLRELTQILLHEYAHFLQWREGLLYLLEGDNLKGGWDVIDKWLKGKKTSANVLNRARNAVLLMEYDADLRAIFLAKKLHLNIGSLKRRLSMAYSYITFLKWAIESREWGEYTVFYNPVILTPTEVLKPLTNKEKEFIEGDYNE